MFRALSDLIIEIFRVFILRDNTDLSTTYYHPKPSPIVRKYRWETPKYAPIYEREFAELTHGIIPTLIHCDAELSLSVQIQHEGMPRPVPASHKFSLVHDHPAIGTLIVNDMALVAPTSRMQVTTLGYGKLYVSDSLVLKDSHHYISDSWKQSPLKCFRFDQSLIHSRIGRVFLNLNVLTSAKVIFEDPKTSPVSAQRIDRADNNKLFKILSGVRGIDPIKRGGGPRGHTDHIPTRIELTEKPEIICWKRGMQWVVGLEVAGKLAERDGFSIIQNEKWIKADQYHAGRWPFEGLFGTVTVRWEDQEDAKEAVFSLNEQNYLLFKLSGRQHNFGRQIKAPSIGWYVVIAPEGWKRYEALSGTPPANPEFLSFGGHIAHFFYLERGGSSKIAFRDATDDTVVIESKASMFELLGTLIVDANEEMGPLFGKTPPRIHAGSDNAWTKIGTVIVGEEGPGRNKWRTQFSPVPYVTAQQLPVELLGRRGGWYFLRFYDENGNLIESLHFRYLKGLHDIKFSSPPYFPIGARHDPVKIEVCHEADCFLRRCERTSSEVATIEENDERTILSIPSRQHYDEIRWQIGYAGGPHVEVITSIDRVWWGVGEEHGEPAEWLDKPVYLSPDDLKATSEKAVWVLFQKPRLADAVHVGFSRPNARPYALQAAKKTVCIPLRDYCDAELTIPGVNALGLWVRYHGTPCAATLCKLKVKASCRWCNFSVDTVDELLSHVESEHLDAVIDDFFSPWNYKQIRDIVPDLPHEIYRCSYCDFYARSNDTNRNPTSAIYEHIKRDCKKVVRSSSGSASVSFRIVSDVGEIRQNVINNLPRMYTCKKCSREFKNPNKAALIDHLKEKHADSLFHPV